MVLILLGLDTGHYKTPFGLGVGWHEILHSFGIKFSWNLLGFRYRMKWKSSWIGHGVTWKFSCFGRRVRRSLLDFGVKEARRSCRFICSVTTKYTWVSAKIHVEIFPYFDVGLHANPLSVGPKVARKSSRV